jgi:hypothetical protein
MMNSNLLSRQIARLAVVLFAWLTPWLCGAPVN